MPVGFTSSGRTVTTHQDEEGAKREREKHKPKTADGAVLTAAEVVTFVAPAPVLTWRGRVVDSVKRFRAWDKANLERVVAAVRAHAR